MTRTRVDDSQSHHQHQDPGHPSPLTEANKAAWDQQDRVQTETEQPDGRSGRFTSIYLSLGDTTNSFSSAGQDMWSSGATAGIGMSNWPTTGPAAHAYLNTPLYHISKEESTYPTDADQNRPIILDASRMHPRAKLLHRKYNRARKETLAAKQRILDEDLQREKKALAEAEARAVKRRRTASVQ